MMMYLFATTSLGFLVLYCSIVDAQPPSNDECINAIVIEPDTALLPYRSDFIDMTTATNNVNDGTSVCAGSGIDFTGWTSVWFEWEPSTTDNYKLTIGGSIIQTLLEVYRGSDCGSRIQVACKFSIRDFLEVRLNATEKNYIKLSGPPDLFRGESATLSIDIIPPPPSNSICANAIEVQLGANVTGDVSFSAFGIPRNEVDCFPYGVGLPTLWYKVQNPFESPIVLFATTCDNFTTTSDTSLTIFKDVDGCSDLQPGCAYGESDAPYFDVDICSNTKAKYSFIADPLSTYYIAVQVSTDDGIFTLKIEEVFNYFALIDSTSDETIGVLQSKVRYSQLRSQKLNIEAVFDSNVNVQSVAVAYDETESRCERLPPYAMFKDRNGDFFDGTITLGEHNVAAVAYTEPNCAGDLVGIMIQKFIVEGCYATCNIYDVTKNEIIDTFDDSSSPPRLPCGGVNFEMVLECGFEIEEVQLTLRRDGRLRPIASRTERIAPYFVFGNKGDVLNKATINAGVYEIFIKVNGVTLPPLGFDVFENCGDTDDDGR